MRGGPRVPIIAHPDVRRMLMTMRAQAEATRALAYVVAARMTRRPAIPMYDQRQRNQAFVDLMIPVVKGWKPRWDRGRVPLGIQVHGGMGYMEETGAAQYPCATRASRRRFTRERPASRPMI